MRFFLAFDTATDHVALALGDLDAPGVVVAARDFSAPRAANTVLLPALEALLHKADLCARDLAAVVVGRGPGSFTGVRIGVASAKGLAHGLGLPLVGFGTLDALAERAAKACQPPVLIGVLGDAMRGEVYPALFSCESDASGNISVRRLSADRVTKPAEVAAEWTKLDRPLVLTGNALAKHSQVFAETCGSKARLLAESLWAPDGASLIAAAWRATGSLTLSAVVTLDATIARCTADPALLLPIYTRLADAEEAERLRLGRPAGAHTNGVAGPCERIADSDSELDKEHM